MGIVQFFDSHSLFSLVSITLLGLIIGSFVNVVIYRLPLIMSNEWREQCNDFLQLNTRSDDAKQSISLSFPSSHCPHCQSAIKPWHNIPIIGYLLLKGKCRSCKQAISPRYPFVEFLCAAVTIVVVAHFGFEVNALFAVILSWSLLAIIFIDIDEQIIPDTISIPLIWLGLLVNTQAMFAPLTDAVIGAAAAYSSLWIFIKAYKFFTGKIGMGNGDFKLFAVFGAWLGWQILPFILILSTIVGAVIGIAVLSTKKLSRDTPIPFGPFLAIAGWIALMWGQSILDWYLQFIV